MGHDDELLAASGATVGGIGPVSDGSALNFHCDSIAGWAVVDGGNSVASLFSGTFFRGYSGLTTDPANLVLFAKNSLFTPPANRSVINLPIEIDHLEDIATGTGSVFFDFTTVNATKRLIIRVFNDGLTIRDSSGVDQPFFIGPPPYGTQFTIRIDIDVTNQLADVWYDDDKKVTSEDCGAPATISGRGAYVVLNTLAAGYISSTVDLDRIVIGGLA